MMMILRRTDGFCDSVVESLCGGVTGPEDKSKVSGALFVVLVVNCRAEWSCWCS